MSLDLVPLHSEFGVVVRGVNLARDLSDALFVDIELAVECHSVVLFRGQDFDDQRQLAFSERFGALEFDHVAYGQEGRIDYIGVIGNIDQQGRRMPLEHKQVVFSTGNYMWHSDSSFRPVPTRHSISYAYEATPEGGELEFLSARSAYARLPEVLKRTIDDLVVIHDYVFSRSKISPDAVTPSHAASLPPVPQKLVRTNPITKEKNYYVGSHARSIENWQDDAARKLLDDLLERATGKDHIYQHRWQAGDLIIWDNRCVLHRGRPYDADRYRRRMHQTRVAGVASSLEEDRFYTG